MGRSRKGRMRGKGGPENGLCDFRGVRQRTWGKWVAEIREPNHGARLWLGTFTTSTEAALAYDDTARKLYGPHAKLNLPDHPEAVSASTSTSQNSSSSDPLASSTIVSVGDRSVTATSEGVEASIFEGFNNGDGLWGSLVMSWPEICLENDFTEMNDIGLVVRGQQFLDWDGLQSPWSW
ncbi:hypothetical protein FNV43_RR02817 [Rhamnella rubrinervis]|uniref:AP2/ERF domain-containing protein n=1 Tax=Rhamnella rubrinervis TaxID=2594499 RepID=A0A8K0HIL1_9ROSA|nr:hypothetical protein FNV43_RR02817 [Rhamnella rubrinervis]